jgi:AAA domain
MTNLYHSVQKGKSFDFDPDYDPYVAREVELANGGQSGPLYEMDDDVAYLKPAVHGVTFFPNQSAQKSVVKQMTLRELRDLIQSTNAKSKDKLPWLKLASFGNKRTDKNCLRHNANALSISGIELDYDSKVMTLDEAISIANDAHLLTLLYTSASYTNATPKWRILLPTSKPLRPEKRARPVARVNGLYGGIFAQESFTLSQAYYFGSVNHNPEHRAVITEGDFIDLREDLDAGAIGKNGGTIDDDAPSVRGSGDPDDQYDNLANELLDPKPAWTPENEDRIWKALCCIPANLVRPDWVEIGMVLHWLHWVDDDGYDWGLEAFDKWSQTSDGNGPGEKGGGYKGRWDIERRWASFGGEKQKLVKTKRLYDIARKYGWKEDTEELDSEELPLRQTSVKAKLMQTSAEFVAGYVPPDYLIDGLLQRRYVYSLTSPTGGGKTSVALRIALHVALGLPLGNREVEQGPVLMFAGENPDDVRSRWILLCEKMGVDPDTVNVVFMPFTLDLSERKIREQIDAEAAEHGPFSLLIVDTSAAYYSGDDENDNVALGNHARMLRTFVNLPGGPTILVTCHPIKTPNMENLLPRGGVHS